MIDITTMGSVSAINNNHHPLVEMTFARLHAILNAHVGVAWVVYGSATWGFLTGLASYTVFCMLEIVMNTIPNFELNGLEPFLRWWAEEKGSVSSYTT